MSFKVILKEEARQDILLAYSWYDSRRPGLGDELIGELDEYLQILEKEPQIFQIRKNNRRFCPLKRFPYILIYEVEHNTVVVYAVFNTHQNPQKHKLH